MKNFRFFFFFLFSLVFTNIQCKKEDELSKLPAITNTGANTIGCLINGNAFPYGEQGVHRAEVTYNAGVLRVSYNVEKEVAEVWYSISDIFFRVKNCYTTGTYFFYSESDHSSWFSACWNEDCYDSYLRNNSFAIVNISRLDTINKVVSGTFQAYLINKFNTDGIKVEQGRFDFRYKP